MIRKEKPAPLQVDTLDQKLLYDILHEQQEQTRYLKRMNTVIQLIGALIILGVFASCLLWLFGG